MFCNFILIWNEETKQKIYFETQFVSRIFQGFLAVIKPNYFSFSFGATSINNINNWKVESLKSIWKFFNFFIMKLVMIKKKNSDREVDQKCILEIQASIKCYETETIVKKRTFY